MILFLEQLYKVMSKEMPIEKKLLEILAKRDFSALTEYTDEKGWIRLRAAERELLGKLFAVQGEDLLLKGDPRALDSFKLAQNVAPDNAHVLFRLAQAYATQKHNLRCLETASKLLEQVVSIEPELKDSWCTWGCILSRLSIIKDDISYLYESNLKFEIAEKQMEKQTTDLNVELYWYWGLALSQLGRLSGEPQDFHKSLGKYRQAADLGLDNSLFWIDYANSLVELSLLIGQADFLLDALKMADRVVTTTPDSFEGWFLRGGIALCIYQCTFVDNYMVLSQQSFERAVSIKEEHWPLWMSWGKLLLIAGKHRHEIDLVQHSFEKLEKAYALEGENPALLALWGEGLIYCGSSLERLDLLREAEAKLVRSLELHSQDPQTWYVYGTCFAELGRYFEDAHYYEQAAEKFRYGLKLKPNSPSLWHGYSLTNFVLGQLKEDPEMLEESIRCCSKVYEYGGAAFVPQLWEDWGVALLELAEMAEEKSYVLSAIEKFERAINYKKNGKETPPDASLLHQCGCAWDLLGEFTSDSADHEKAVAMLTQAIILEPNHAEARYSLAVAFMQLGELVNNHEYYLKALEHFEVLTSLESEDQDAWQEWGIAIIKLAQLTHEPAHPERNQYLYAQAEDKLLHAIGLGSEGAVYDLCGLYALMGNFEMAMHYIERCKAQGVLPPVDALMHDEWLEDLRQTSEFRSFISMLVNKSDDAG